MSPQMAELIRKMETLEDELEAALDHLRHAPKEGVVQLIVRRPKVDEREVMDEAELDPVWCLPAE